MYKTVVFSGGGPYGVCHLGALKRIQHKLRNVQTIVGCSVGAIIGLFLSIGMDSDDMMTWVNDNIEKLLPQIEINNVLGIIDNLGLDDGTTILNAISVKFAQYLPNEYDVVRLTFIDFAKIFGINLIISVTNISTNKREYMSIDTTPHLQILTAIRMSISVPIYFTPIIWNNQMYIDGALTDSCPIIDDSPTLIFDISGFCSDEQRTITGYLFNLISSIMNRRMQYKGQRSNIKVINMINPPSPVIFKHGEMCTSPELLKTAYDFGFNVNMDSI